MVIVEIDTRQIGKATRALGHIKNGVPRALVPAINRSLSSGRTTLKREIRKNYLIKAKDIPITMRGANYGHLGGDLRIKQGMLELGKFKVKPRGMQRRKAKKPITVQVKVSGGGKLLRHAFMTDALNYAGPYQRKGKSRLPIKALLTIGAPIMASQPTVGPAVNKSMGDTLDKRIDHEIKRVLAITP